MHLAQQKTVLVVEDDEPLCQTLADVVENIVGLSSPVRSHTALSAEEAQLLLEKLCFDLVLTDLNLPGRDGLQLISWLRQSQSPSRAVPVLLLTGTLLDPSEQNFSALPEGVWVRTKPIVYEDIEAVVTSLLLQRTAGCSSAL